MRMKMLVLATAIASGLSLAASAQQHQHSQPQQGQGRHQQHHGGHGSHGAASKTTDHSPSTAAFQAANARMHKDMDITFSGDADVDFVKGMIPHHQGAIDMAKVVLGFGKDPETRKLAEEIIKAQESEIAMMREWLKKKGH